VPGTALAFLRFAGIFTFPMSATRKIMRVNRSLKRLDEAGLTFGRVFRLQQTPCMSSKIS
jgi:hypothetical protein